MDTTVFRLTVLFQEPFWVGVYERESSGKYHVCKMTFGAEPKDYEVYQFLLENWHRLRFGLTIETAGVFTREVNPKRRQREAKKQVQSVGLGTKAQQALKAEQEQGKLQRKAASREQKEALLERKFSLKQEKRKKKHKGH